MLNLLERLAPQLFTYAVLLVVILVAWWRAVRDDRATGERIRAEAAARAAEGQADDATRAAQYESERKERAARRQAELEAYLARIDQENDQLQAELTKMEQARNGVSLELALTLTGGADADAVLTRVSKLVESLDRFERKIGGQGVRWDEEGASAVPGTLTLVLHPNDPAGSRERMRRLADIVAYEIERQPDVDDFTVRGFLTTDAEQTVFEESPSLAA